MARQFHADNTHPAPNQIFVFGSNLSGIHGAGAARAAYDHYGAIWGKGEGPMGNSYAIPTKDYDISATLSLITIAEHIKEFIEYARYNPHLNFFITRIGCGLAGYQNSDIAPLFKQAPENCDMPINWFPYLT